MAYSHFQLYVAIKVAELNWPEWDDALKLKFFDETVTRYGLDVIRETVGFFIEVDKNSDVIAYLAERSA